MTDNDYPLTGYGVELRTKKGWVLPYGTQRSRGAAEHVRKVLIDQHAPDPGDLRVVELTITRKDTP